MDEFIGFGVRDLAVEYHWRELERPAVLKTAVPKILIFPGDGTETAEQANGFCKAVSQAFGKTNAPEIYSIYYKDNSSCAAHRLHQKAGVNQLDDARYPLGREPQPYLDTFYQEQILPLISIREGREKCRCMMRPDISEQQQSLLTATAARFCLPSKTNSAGQCENSVTIPESRAFC